MELERLKSMVYGAVKFDPPRELADFCGQYYSPYYVLLYILANGMDSPIAVELGVETGRGSKALLLGGAIVYGVEQDPLKNVERLQGASNFTLIKASSTPPPAGIPEGISILHIDTEHSFAQAREEFNAYKPYLKDGAVVCFDDTNAMEGEVLRFVESLPYERIVDDRLHPGCGYAVILYRKETENV